MILLFKLTVTLTVLSIVGLFLIPQQKPWVFSTLVATMNLSVLAVLIEAVWIALP